MSQNCFIVFTSSNLLAGFVALNSNVSSVAAWLTVEGTLLDLDGEFEGDAFTGGEPEMKLVEHLN